MFPNLKLQLWRSGMRQNRLAQMLELDETVLSRIVNGFRRPTEDQRQAISACLRCDVDWLFAPDPGAPGERAAAAAAGEPASPAGLAGGEHD